MPYIVASGYITAPALSTGEDTIVLGLNHNERTKFSQVMNESIPHSTKIDMQTKLVTVRGKGLTLLTVNRLHTLFGYDVISHSMAMTNTNLERMSWTLYKKSDPTKPHRSM